MCLMVGGGGRAQAGVEPECIQYCHQEVML